MKFNKNVRIVLIVIMLILTGSSSVLLYCEVSYPEFKEEKVALYRYNNKANVNYRAYLKPNILYSGENNKKDTIYITEFIDYINTFMKYEFSGERGADIKGDYEIIAVVEGYTAEGEKCKSIWNKKFRLLEKTLFNSNDQIASIQQELPIDFQKYNNFARQIIEDTKISCQVKMTIFWNIHIKAQTDKGLIEDIISPTMIIPLNNNYFEITGQLAQEKPGAIEETKEIEVPVNKKIVITCGVVIGVLSIILVFLLFCTKGILITNPLEKKLKKIFKNHGDRLVALDNEVMNTCENYNKVKSIDDLVRIADEIAKPIMYKYTSDFKEMTKFYVFDDTQMYMLDLKDVLLEENKEKDKLTNNTYRFGKSLLKLKNKSVHKEEAETEKET